VELYRRVSDVPPEFNSVEKPECGSIVIWTRWRRPVAKVKQR
jgi:hypothetical protein